MERRAIKVLVKVYKHEKTFQREFSSFYDAQGSIELMRKNDPDLIVEPYVEVSDTCEIETSEMGSDEFTDCFEDQGSSSLASGKLHRIFA